METSNQYKANIKKFEEIDQKLKVYMLCSVVFEKRIWDCF